VLTYILLTIPLKKTTQNYYFTHDKNSSFYMECI